MINVHIEGVDPKNNNELKYNISGKAVCVVSVEDSDDTHTKGAQLIIGSFGASESAAMIDKLTDACVTILDNLPPLLALAILENMSNKLCEGAKENLMKGGNNS